MDLEKHLLEWLNWVFPATEDCPYVENLEDVKGSNRIYQLLVQLFPKELIPQKEYSLTYVYSVVVSLLKLHRKGPNNFINPLKQDLKYDMKIILLNLFFLYNIMFSDKLVFDDPPSWSLDLLTKFGKFKESANSNLYDLTSFIKQLEEEKLIQNSQKEQILNDCQKDKTKSDSKFSQKTAMYDSIIHKLDQEISDLQSSHNGLLQQKNNIIDQTEKQNINSETITLLSDNLSKLELKKHK